jgi:hypothetical protein
MTGRQAAALMLVSAVAAGTLVYTACLLLSRGL